MSDYYEDRFGEIHYSKEQMKQREKENARAEALFKRRQGMKKLHIEVPRALRDEVRHYCDRENMTQSTFIKSVLKDFFGTLVADGYWPVKDEDVQKRYMQILREEKAKYAEQHRAIPEGKKRTREMIKRIYSRSVTKDTFMERVIDSSGTIFSNDNVMSWKD